MNEGSAAEMAPQRKVMSTLSAEAVTAARDSKRPFVIESNTTGRLEVTVPNPHRDPKVREGAPFVTVDLGLVTTDERMRGKPIGMGSDHRSERPDAEPAHTVRFDMTSNDTQGGTGISSEDRALVLKRLLRDEALLAERGVKPTDVARIDLVVGVDKTLFPPISEVPLARQEGIIDVREK